MLTTQTHKLNANDWCSLHKLTDKLNAIMLTVIMKLNAHCGCERNAGIHLMVPDIFLLKNTSPTLVVFAGKISMDTFS